MCEIHELWSVHAYGQVSDEILNERERESTIGLLHVHFMSSEIQILVTKTLVREVVNHY